MPWVALEDDFTANPKIVQLTDSELRSWLSLLCWAARFRTNGFVPKTIGNELAGITPRRVEKWVRLRMLEERSDGWLIHDWEEFNGTKKEREQARLRKQAQRQRERNVTPPDRDNVTPVDRDMSREKSRPSRGRAHSAHQSPTTTSTPAVARPPTNGLPFESTSLALSLINHLRHKDDKTPNQILAFAQKLPPAAFARVREELTERSGAIQNDAGYAVRMLQRMVDEHQYAA
jgi:hypothetical protein